MSIDKKIDYVDQDGYKNYTKNSKSVTVPKEFKARKNAPATKLAYITDAEEKQLKKQNPGTPHKGPSNVPSYDSFDAQGSYTSGSAMSAAESGRNTSDTLDAGMTGRDVQDIRSSVIAAGAGQRVNPGFFDSRNRISPQELALARQFTRRGDDTGDLARLAMRRTRGGGIMDFFTGGGFLGNIIRGLGRKFGLGKNYNEPTYDMRGVVGSVNPNNLDIYNEFVDDEDNERETQTFTFDPSGMQRNDGIMSVADALTIPTFDDSGVSLRKRMTLYNAGYNDRQIKEALDGGYLDELVRDIEGPIGIV